RDRESMLRKHGTRLVLPATALCLTSLGAWCAFRPTTESLPKGSGGPDKKNVSHAEDGPASPADPLEQRFATRVRPFLQRYCFSCHGPKKQKASLDLSRDATVTAVANHARQ